MKEFNLPNINYNEELSKCKTINDLVGRNGRTSFGDVDINIPRDRNSEFEPKIVKKYGTVCNELDKKIISLYVHGMTHTLNFHLK